MMIVNVHRFALAWLYHTLVFLGFSTAILSVSALTDAAPYKWVTVMVIMSITFFMFVRYSIGVYFILTYSIAVSELWESMTRIQREQFVERMSNRYRNPDANVVNLENFYFLLDFSFQPKSSPNLPLIVRG